VETPHGTSLISAILTCEPKVKNEMLFPSEMVLLNTMQYKTAQLGNNVVLKTARERSRVICIGLESVLEITGHFRHWSSVIKLSIFHDTLT
jgi:hypothetical protein